MATHAASKLPTGCRCRRCHMADHYQRAKRNSILHGSLFIATLVVILAIVGPSLG